MAERDAAINMAIDVLYRLTGRQFGACPVIVRPCPNGCEPYGTMIDGWHAGLYAYLDNGQWRNSVCACGTGACTRSGPTVIHLPGPVHQITRVTIDGAVWDPSTVRLEGDFLYRVDCEAWPSQNLQCALSEPGTWSIEYLRGTPPPAGVGVLVGKLALEFLNACTGGKCRLPRRVQSVTRQGVSYQMVDPTDLLASGKTGLPEVDLFLAATNPHQVQRRPKVR